jgi:uncharacterized protein (TIGR02145 family)
MLPKKKQTGTHIREICDLQLIVSVCLAFILSHIVTHQLHAQTNRHLIQLENSEIRVDSIHNIDSITIMNGAYSLWNNGAVYYQIDINNLDHMNLGDCHLGVFNDDLEYGNVADNEGNVYRTIVIGSQVWMAENLKTSHFNNGDEIPIIQADSDWQAASAPACCSIFNDAQFDCPYGKLYNRYVVLDARGVCPVGFHIPTQSEWNELILFVDPQANVNAYGTNSQSDVAGGYLKSVGNLNWADNTTGTNSSGFSAVGSSDRYSGFGYIDNFHDFSGFYESSGAYRTIAGWGGHVQRWSAWFHYGLSIRCIQD